MKKEPKIISMGRINLGDVPPCAPPNLDSLPVLATRNLVLFPGVAIPIALKRSWSAEIVQKALSKHITIGIACQLDPEIENPTSADDLAPYGVFAEVIQIFDLPDGTKSAFVRATSRFKVHGDADAPSIPGSLLNLKVTRVNDNARGAGENFSTMAQLIVEIFNDLSSKMDEEFHTINQPNFKSPVDTINYVATHAPASIPEKIDMLATYRVLERGEKLVKILSTRQQEMQLAHDIMERAREEISEDQREMFLRKQMEVMQRELYGDTDDVEDLTNRFNSIAEEVSAAGRHAFEKGIAQLRRLSTNSPDYFVCYNYLTTLLELPWGKYSASPDNLQAAKNVLDADHYGMKKVKERIVEQLAVALNNPEGKAPILCLVGAPGVGKTSLGESIAKALGREYRRVALGGISDEAEIRGHRRTYIGAMPGRIMDAVRRVNTNNPLLLLDEIDKLSRDHKGDPSSALLEVLDPEQNCRFHDNYIDVDYDLSKVMFIATANTLDTVARPLLDRMEVIEVPGYLLEEKREIARRHIFPRVLKEIGFEENEISLSDDALTAIIEGYTSESGVRQLEKNLSSLARKLLVKKLSDENPSFVISDAAQVKELLGAPRYNPQKSEIFQTPGVVTGLAWTAHGGEILFIESSLSKGNGEKLSLTGNLGDVMKESAAIALQYVRSHADQLGIPAEMFEKHNLHIHVPEGAVPKDGPSAGITMAVSIASTFTGRMVKPRLAMTGEITLRGRVMPVGGIKEKILAAKRAGITDIILSEENRRDLEEIEPQYLDGVTFHHVNTVDEVLSLSLI